MSKYVHTPRGPCGPVARSWWRDRGGRDRSSGTSSESFCRETQGSPTNYLGKKNPTTDSRLLKIRRTPLNLGSSAKPQTGLAEAQGSLPAPAPLGDKSFLTASTIKLSAAVLTATSGGVWRCFRRFQAPALGWPSLSTHTRGVDLMQISSVMCLLRQPLLLPAAPRVRWLQPPSFPHHVDMAPVVVIPTGHPL